MKLVQQNESRYIWTQRTTTAINAAVNIYEKNHGVRLLHHLQKHLPQDSFFSYLLMCGKQEDSIR